jgi:branched-chain amino acid aminotransferase
MWPDELATAEEVFVTGSAAEVTAIGQIADHRYQVGPITRLLRDDYEKLVRQPAASVAA